MGSRIKEEQEGREATEIRRAINICNKKMRASLKKDRDEVDKSKAIEILNEMDIKKRWTKFKDFENEVKEPDSISGLDSGNGVLFTEEKDMVELHANHLETTHSFPQNSLFLEDWKTKIEADVSEKEVDLQPVFTLPFTPLNDDIETGDLSREEVQTREEESQLNEVVNENEIEGRDKEVSNEEVLEVLRLKSNKSVGGSDGWNYKIQGISRQMSFKKSTYLSPMSS